MDQLKLQASRHAAHLERLKSGYVKEFEPFLADLKKNLKLQLMDENLAALGRTKLEDLVKTVDKISADAFHDYEKVLLNQITELADYEIGFEVRSLQNVVTSVSFNLPSATQLKAAVYGTPLGLINGPDAGSLLNPFISKWADSEAKSVSNMIRLGAAQGKTTPEVIKDIIGTVSRYTGSSLERAKSHAETIARTALQHTAIQAREATFAANADLIEFVEWSSILDGVTSVQCRSLSNQKFPLDSGPRPPAHPRCRSSMVPVLRAPYDRLSRGGEQKARAPTLDKNGNLVRGPIEQIPATTTYYSWLKRQPAAVQDSIVGPTRGLLLRNGGISSQRFAELQLDKNFMPITLEKMRELDPIAFINANIPD
jgi:SPP1 gp7 family putative phage head morphogenesis protein